MARIVTVAAAQLGPIARADSRARVVERMLALMRQAKSHGCDLVVFPELALTTFFPRWYFERQEEIDAFFEREMPGPDTQRLFDAARSLGIGFCLGYAELANEDGRTRRFNTSPRRQGRAHRRQVPQDPSARARRARTVAALPASAETVFRGRQSGIPGVPRGFRRRRRLRHGDL